MALTMQIDAYLKLVPALRNAPQGVLWSSYDAEADVLYINFRRPSHATDSELSEDDVIVRYDGDEVVGLTVLHASRRLSLFRQGRNPVGLLPTPRRCRMAPDCSFVRKEAAFAWSPPIRR